MSVLSKEQVKDIVETYGIKTALDAQEAVKDIMKDVLQKTLEAELDESLGYEKYDRKGSKKSGSTNSRNGSYGKTVKSGYGNIELEIPRDRENQYESMIIKKGESDVSGLQDRIISMYAKGMSTRDIHAHMKDIYGIEVSAEMVSKITDRILPSIREWQNRRLSSIYAIVYMDAIHFNVREEGRIIKKAVYLAMGIDCDGMKDVLGIWVGGNESSKYWLGVLTELQNRGVEDILISCIDGLSGFEDAINTVFPKTQIQRCIVHQIRYCCKFVNYKDRKQFCADMKLIYTSASEEIGLEALVGFDKKWGKKYGYAVKSWESNWASLATFFKFPSDIRRLIYTTNPIESLNSCIRKVAGPKRIFPTDDAALKSVFLAVQNRIKKWSTRPRNWSAIFGQLLIHFDHRLKEVAIR